MERVTDLRKWKGPKTDVIATLGNFDGMHLGHQALVERLLEWHDVLRLPTMVVSFDPHPAALLRPHEPRRELVPLPDRLRLLERLGIDVVVVLRFDNHLRGMSAEEFFREILVQRLRAKHLVLGPDSRFGRDRAGGFSLCSELGSGCEVTCDEIDPLEVEGQPISSTRIRDRVAAGDVAGLPELLGRYYRLRGEVRKGAGRGATLGFPTANVDAGPALKPADGVYAGRLWAEGVLRPAAISVGTNPTFNGPPITTVEAHVLDFEGDLYGQVVSVEFQERLRGMERFEGPEPLIAQMHRDVARVRELIVDPA
jgi:riboflavin kinase/FMN adenylyltransferase